jgi:hypothetical protein
VRSPCRFHAKGDSRLGSSGRLVARRETPASLPPCASGGTAASPAPTPARAAPGRRVRGPDGPRTGVGRRGGRETGASLGATMKSAAFNCSPPRTSSAIQASIGFFSVRAITAGTFDVAPRTGDVPRAWAGQSRSSRMRSPVVGDASPTTGDRNDGRLRRDRNLGRAVRVTSCEATGDPNEDVTEKSTTTEGVLPRC